jgi:Family of unknown function (DUF5335)
MNFDFIYMEEVNIMTIEIPKEKWTEFFDDLSKRRFGWETKIEVLDESVGDQILTLGLPLNGITFEEKSGRHEIEIAVGETSEQHQMHNITNPQKVAYLYEGDFLGGVIEIEDEKNTKTLISLLNPMPIYIGYGDYEIVMASLK